jgi:hypothetical protein
MVYVTERLMEAGFPLIIEGNFTMRYYAQREVPGGEGGVIKKLIGRYGYEPLTYIFYGDTNVLCDRFNARENTPARGQANQIFGKLTYEDCAALLPPLADFSVGGTRIQVDTTDFSKVDFDGLLAKAEDLLNNND